MELPQRGHFCEVRFGFFHHRDAEFAEFGVFLIEDFLCVLRASAVNIRVSSFGFESA
jgi:hypothetical protein